MKHSNWQEEFRSIYGAGVEAYKGGKRTPGAIFEASQRAALATIGCTAQELFDFVEDSLRYGEPDYDTALLITSVRRDYFLQVQKGVPSTRLTDMDRLPAKSAALAGIVWLPRVIQKARSKLRGEMPPELMYCCGGDREFFDRVNIHPADFLRYAWAAGDDQDRILRFVQNGGRP